MRIVLNLFVLILLFSTSCKSDKKESNFKTEPRMHDSIYYKNLKTINVDIRNIETIKLSNLYDSIRLVSLETNPDIVMGEIVKLEIHDNNLYFQTPKSLFIYNNKGEFLNKISNSGKGPGEYLSLSDFYIDKDEKVIEIYDNKKKQIIKYSFSGDFLEKIDVHLDGYSFTKLNENKYAIYIGSGYYNQESNSRLNILDGKGNIEKRIIRIKDNEAKFLHLGDLTNFQEFDGHKYFLYSFNDTIYNITDKGIKPKYIVDFGEKALPKEFLEDYYRDIGEFLDKCKKTDSAFRVIGFFETNDLIAFGLMYKYGVIHVYYSKTTEKTMVVNELENDMFLSGLKNKSTYLNLPKAVNKSNLYTIINAYNFIEEVDKLKTKMTSSEWELFIKQNKKIDSIYKNIDIQDNPIIMIGKIK